MPDIKAGIIGATGYVGIELLRLITDHPYCELAAASSKSFENQNINDVYKNFTKISHIKLTDEDDVIEKSDIVFACLPHGHSQEIAKKTIDAGKLFIDLGADFRLMDEAAYKEWYGEKFSYPDLHKEAVYGLCELFRDKIEDARLIANPGCYPTAAALALAPALLNDLIEEDSIVIDAKSGTTGAGKGLSQTLHFPECNENFAAYKVCGHRHTPEIEQTLSVLAKKEIKVTFTPHLLPINRGIEATVYAKLKTDTSLESIYALYEEQYCAEDYVRLLPLGEAACIRNVKLSNYCDISVFKDERTNRLVVISCIDNMIKGAAGQAVQNMNILFGLPEFTGLGYIPPVF